MASISDVAQIVGSVGSVTIAAVAVIVNGRLTRANLDSQQRSAAAQLEAQRESLQATLDAKAEEIRDERLWDRRFALYEDLGAWSGDAFSASSRLIFEVQALPAKDFQQGFQDVYQRFSEAVSGRYATLYGRVQLYAAEDVRTAFTEASPSILGLGGDYTKKNAGAWATAVFTAVTSLQEALHDTVSRLSRGAGRGPDHPRHRRSPDPRKPADEITSTEA